MAKTYKPGEYIPIDVSGTDYSDLVNMTEADKIALQNAKDSWQAHTDAGDIAGANEAHRIAELIRAKYGYSGSTDGSAYISHDVPQFEYNEKPPQFSYGSAPSYISKRQSQIDQLADKILNRKEFSYDPNNDPLYKNYQDSYTRNGQQAMENTLGEVSARTGGLASSYAGVAAQQTYNRFMDALADKIPELEKMRYDRYMDNLGLQMQDLGMIQGLERDDYQKYLTQLNQFNADRNLAFDKYSSELNQFNNDRNFAYNNHRDSVLDRRYETEKLTQAQQDEQERIYRQNLMRAELLAQVGDYSGYQALGLSAEDVAKIQSAMAAGIGSTGGGGGSRRRGGGGPRKSPSPAPSNVNSYSSAQSYLKSQGLTAQAGMKTQREWTRNKQGFKTYSDYLNSYVQYALETKR